jgi:hypothetical protein
VFEFLNIDSRLTNLDEFEHALVVKNWMPLFYLFDKNNVSSNPLSAYHILYKTLNEMQQIYNIPEIIVVKIIIDYILPHLHIGEYLGEISKLDSADDVTVMMSLYENIKIIYDRVYKSFNGIVTNRLNGVPNETFSIGPCKTSMECGGSIQFDISRCYVHIPLSLIGDKKNVKVGGDDAFNYLPEWINSFEPEEHGKIQTMLNQKSMTNEM